MLQSEKKKTFVAASKGKLRIYTAENFGHLVKEIDFFTATLDKSALRLRRLTVFTSGLAKTNRPSIGIVECLNQRSGFVPKEYKPWAPHPLIVFNWEKPAGGPALEISRI